jgi:hypothetical protein
VVTALEMREAPASLRRLVPEQDVPLQLVRWKAPDPAKYRLLFRRVGAKWLWWSRLALDDAALGAIIHDPQVHVFAVADRAVSKWGCSNSISARRARPRSPSSA